MQAVHAARPSSLPVPPPAPPACLPRKRTRAHTHAHRSLLSEVPRNVFGYTLGMAAFCGGWVVDGHTACQRTDLATYMLAAATPLLHARAHTHKPHARAHTAPQRYKRACAPRAAPTTHSTRWWRARSRAQRWRGTTKVGGVHLRVCVRTCVRVRVYVSVGAAGAWCWGPQLWGILAAASVDQMQFRRRLHSFRCVHLTDVRRGCPRFKKKAKCGAKWLGTCRFSTPTVWPLLPTRLAAPLCWGPAPRQVHAMGGTHQ
jgi:hypothetical protein